MAETKKVALDFSALTPEDAPTVSASSTKFAQLDGSPVLDWLETSKETGKGMRVPTPNVEHAKRLAYLLRLGAEKLGYGLRLPAQSDPSVVVFAAKDRKKADGPRKPGKPRKGETAEAFRARVDEWVRATGKTWEPPAAKP